MDRPNPLARILIVEDESIVAMDLAGQLRDLGHEVVGIADNAEDALRLASLCRPDLTLLDVRLKGPRDGVEVADALARQHDAAVLYLTAYSDAETVARAARTVTPLSSSFSSVPAAPPNCTTSRRLDCSDNLSWCRCSGARHALMRSAT